MAALLYLIPLVAGVLVAVLKLDFAVSMTDSLETWLHQKRMNNGVRQGFIRRWFLRPFFWGGSQVMRLTEGINNEYIQSGTRIVLFSIFMLVAAMVAYVAAIFIAVLIGVVIVLWIVFAVLGASDGASKPVPQNPFKGRGRYKNKNVYIDEKGVMRDAESMYPFEVARVSNDGNVTESGSIFGPDGVINGRGDIKDAPILGDKIGHINPD